MEQIQKFHSLRKTPSKLTDVNWDRKSPEASSSYAPYKIYNIGNNNPVKLIHFIRTLEKIIGKKVKMEFYQCSLEMLRYLCRYYRFTNGCRIVPYNNARNRFRLFYRLVHKISSKVKMVIPRNLSCKIKMQLDRCYLVAFLF